MGGGWFCERNHRRRLDEEAKFKDLDQVLMNHKLLFSALGMGWEVLERERELDHTGLHWTIEITNRVELSCL